MGQQLNKIVKRRRRKLYLDRKKALAKTGVARKARVVKSATKVAKKAPAKKAAAKKVKAVVAAVPEATAQE